MNSEEKRKVMRMAHSNITIRRLLKKHNEYKDRIRVIRKKSFLSAIDEQEVRNLKMKKLKGKDQMLRLIDSVESVDSNSAPSQQSSEFGIAV